DAAQLKWLENDLKRVKKGTPIFLFSQHAIAGSMSKIDNSGDLLRILAPHNIALSFSGMEHDSEKRGDGKVNGIRLLSAEPGKSSVHVVEVGSQEIRVSIQGPDGKSSPVSTILRDGGQRRKVAFAWDDPNVPLLARRQFLAELHGDKGPVKDDRIKAQY